MKLARFIALALSTLIVSSLGLAQELEINMIDATVNGEAICELTIDEATDILGRPSAVEPPLIEVLGEQIFYHDLGLEVQFNSTTVDPEKRVLYLSIYFAETYDSERTKLYQPYSGVLTPEIDANFKVEKTESTLDELGVSYVAVTPDEHREELKSLGLSVDPSAPQLWTVRHEGDSANANFQHEELTQFLETASVTCENN